MKTAQWQSLRAEYLRSVKHTDTEELFDLVLFRPLAFVLTKILAGTRITPNQVTVVATLAFLLAAFLIGAHGPFTLAWAAVAVGLANILDCADGQLARLRKQNSPQGRIVDGIGDYVGVVGLFAGIAVWGADRTADVIPWAWIALLSLLCFGWQAALIDDRRNRYLSRTLPPTAGSPEGRSRSSNSWSHRLEEAYERLQRLAQFSRSDLPDRRATAPGRAERILIRAWCLNGTATARFLCILACIADRIDLFLAYILVLGTFWTVGLLLAERLLDVRTVSSEGA